MKLELYSGCAINFPFVGTLWVFLNIRLLVHQTESFLRHYA
jgi:hypothetical protein